jgi:hypothetical protein
MTPRDSMAITEIVDAFIRKDHPKQKQALSIILHELCRQHRVIAANQVRESILLREQAAREAAREMDVEDENFPLSSSQTEKYETIEDWRKDNGN